MYAGRLYTRTVSASGSASNTASVTSPRSSPSACSGSGVSHRTSKRSSSWAASTCGSRASVPRKSRSGEPRHRARRHPRRRDEVEPHAAFREPQRERAGVGVGTAAAGEHERRAAVADDLELRLEVQAPPREQARDGGDEDDVSRPAPVVGAPARLDAAHHLRIEPDARREAEAPTVDPAEADLLRPALDEGVGDPRRGRTGSRGSPSAREKTLAPPPGRKPNGISPPAPLIASL